MANPRGTTVVPDVLLHTLCEIVITVHEDLDVYDEILHTLTQNNIREIELDSAIEYAKVFKYSKR